MRIPAPPPKPPTASKDPPDRDTGTPTDRAPKPANRAAAFTRRGVSETQFGADPQALVLVDCVRPRFPLGRSARHTGRPTPRLNMTKPQVSLRFCSLLLVSEGGLEPAKPPRSSPVFGLLSADPLRFGRFRDRRRARCATWGRTDC
jgi:hypothetical protein